MNKVFLILLIEKSKRENELFLSTQHWVLNKQEGGGGGWRNCISSVVSCGNLFHSFLTTSTERMMWKLAPNHASIFSKQQTVGKISDNELLSPENSGPGWNNVFLPQEINKRGGGLQ